MTKKNIRNLIVGLVVILIFAGAYLGVVRYMEMKEKKQAEDDRKLAESVIVLSVDPDHIHTVSFDGDDGEIVFENHDGEWICPDDETFEMNPSKMNLILSDLSALSATRTLENAGEKEQYGLGTAAKEIRITEQDGKESTLYVGIRNKSNHDLYFQLDQEADTVYMTSTALDSHFSGSLKNFAMYESFPEIEPSLMRVFDVQKEESYTLDMPGDDNCTVTDADGNSQRANLNLVGTMQDNFSNIIWADNVEYNCQDFAQYGLDQPLAVIETTYETSRGGETESFALSVGNQDEKGNYYVRLDESLQVHTIRKEYLIDFVENRPSSFWSLTYSFVSIGDLERLEVTSKDGTHVMRRKAENNSEEEMIWLVDDQSIEKSLFTDFYYACVSVTAQERLDDVPETEGTAVLTLHYDLTDGSEKEISYYEHDQNFYLVIYENGTKAAYTNKLYVNTMLENLDTMLEALK